MNLCVIIPAYNEQETLPQLLADIPRVIAGVDSVKVIVINDGSNDLTAKYAYLFGADAVVNFTRNRGLAAAFEAGINTALAMGADIIVNLDADYQYLPSEIPLLIAPILKGEADVAIGDRQTDNVKEFSWLKRRLQRSVNGLAFFVLAGTLDQDLSRQLPLLVGGYLLARAIGFLSLITPTGIGVREAVLVAALSPYSPSAAMASALLARFLSTAAEGLNVVLLKIAVSVHRLPITDNE